MGASYILITPRGKNPSIGEIILATLKSVGTTFRGDIQNNPDIKKLSLPDDKKSIGISESKKAVSFLAEKPFIEETKVLIIEPADRLTTEAQNSLLKILEEPPEYATIILVTEKRGSLLDTVQSRCKIVRMSRELKIVAPTNERIFTKSIGERLVLVEELAKLDKEEITEVLLAELAALRSAPHKKASDLAELNSKINDISDFNVNIKLALEDLFCSISQVE